MSTQNDDQQKQPADKPTAPNEDVEGGNGPVSTEGQGQGNSSPENNDGAI